jgi:hypothetical protein
MGAPNSINLLADEQGTMDSHDNIRTRTLTMHQQSQHNLVPTVSGATMMWGNENLDFSTAEMHGQNLSGRIQQGIQETQVAMMKGSYGADNELEFSVTTHVSQRAMISNTILNRSSEKPISHCNEDRSFGEQRWCLAPECLQTFKQEQCNTMYEAQELDIIDSDVLGMWLSSKVQEED